MKSSPVRSMKECNRGRIHSIETFGTVDGPGTRYVIFFQGCPFRCLYCHNPDTWSGTGGTLLSVDEVLRGFEKNAAFYKNGGLTASGGEPLLQLEFLTELFTEAKKRGIHTCLDTSGAVYHPDKQSDYEALLAHTDLVLLDIKHSIPSEHERLTGHPMDAPLGFATLLSDLKIPMVIRHVLVPEITDNTEQLKELGILMKQFQNLVGLEVLPFHQMGTAKYENLGIPYPLKDVKALTKEDATRARKVILEAYYY